MIMIERTKKHTVLDMVTNRQEAREKYKNFI